MTNGPNCERYRPHLSGLVDGDLSDELKARVNDHLDDCAGCREIHAGLWDLAAMASRWDEQPVPHWQPGRVFFDDNRFMPTLQFVSAFVSVAVMVLMLGQVQVSTADGITVHFGEKFVRATDFDRELNAFREDQALQLTSRFDRLTDQQAASNQLLMHTLSTMSREERRDELEALLVLLDEAQDQRSQRTEANLRFLLANQLEDRRNIQQLGEALRLVANEGGTL